MVKKMLLYVAWLQAVAGMVGSLYFSEFLHVPPCALCWYQRILLYPLVIIIAVGILRKDKDLAWYVLPLSIGGIVVAFYQVLLQQGIIPEKLLPCTTGVPCSVKYVELFGFVTIPLLSLVAFIVITVCVIIAHRLNSNK